MLLRESCLVDDRKGFFYPTRVMLMSYLSVFLRGIHWYS